MRRLNERVKASEGNRDILIISEKKLEYSFPKRCFLVVDYKDWVEMARVEPFLSKSDKTFQRKYLLFIYIANLSLHTWIAWVSDSYLLNLCQV